MRINYWYKKPHWWQWKKKRYYASILETTDEGIDLGLEDSREVEGTNTPQ